MEHNPFKHPEDIESEYRALRMSLLTLCKGIESVRVAPEPHSPAYIVGLKYSEEDAKALQYAMQFETTTDYLLEHVGSSAQDQEIGFKISEDDRRQLNKIIEIVKSQLTTQLVVLKDKVEEEQKTRPEASVGRLLAIIDDKIKGVNSNIMQLEIILIGL